MSADAKTYKCHACGAEFATMAELQAHAPVCPHAPTDELTDDQVLFLLELLRMDIEAQPFKHEDFWTALERVSGGAS